VPSHRQPTTDNRQPFSRRAQWNAPLNRLTLARREHRGELLDLTETNPTRVGLPYPLDELSEALARGARAAYDPEPRGLRSAREALGEHLGCDAGDLLLTASTSEAYAFLFKLLTDPGDAVLTATPTYPLLEHLAAMEQIELHYFPLEFQGRWGIEPSRIAAAITRRTRALVVVNPNNPTGSFVREHELAGIELPLIADEVFIDYPLDGRGTSLVRDNVLTFTLGGLSKSAGLPHFKLGWIRASGPGKHEALDALELIADNFLSVATPIQIALPEILAIAPRIREAIHERTSANLTALKTTIATNPAAAVLPVEGGWSAVIRVPRIESDEALALRLIQEHGVVVHPGYFFDFDADGYIVVSLLTEKEIFAEGIARIIAAHS
jgi:aspartate/methionine/tyrosine aminotransferase